MKGRWQPEELIGGGLRFRDPGFTGRQAYQVGAGEPQTAHHVRQRQGPEVRELQARCERISWIVDAMTGEVNVVDVFGMCEHRFARR